jgi:hypothetical protein
LIDSGIHSTRPTAIILDGAFTIFPEHVVERLGHQRLQAAALAALAAREHVHRDRDGLLTMAPTRSGKGVGTIISNLLLLDRLVICIDPKRENARVMARARAKKG